MGFATLLTHCREKSRVSKTELAKRIGRSVGYIINLESGRKKPPPLEIVKLICDALGLADSDKNDLIKSAALERLPDIEKEVLRINEKKTIEVKPSCVPIVSTARSGKVGESFMVEAVKGEQEYIDLTNCEAVLLVDDSMTPTAFAGNKIVYNKKIKVVDGDLVFVRLLTGEQYFKRFYMYQDFYAFQGANVALAPQKPLIAKKSEVVYMYKVVAIVF